MFDSPGFISLSQVLTYQLHSDHTKIGYAMFPDIRMKHLLPKLTKLLKEHGFSKAQGVNIPKWRQPVPEEDNDAITHAWLWSKMSSFFKPRDVVVTETGMISKLRRT